MIEGEGAISPPRSSHQSSIKAKLRPLMGAAAITYTRMAMRTQKFLMRCLPGKALSRMLGGSRAKAAISSLLRRYIIPHRIEWVQVLDGPAKGLWVHIDLATERDWWSGKHEPAIHDVLLRALSPQKIMYDVGAHLGLLSLPAARLGAHVISFERDPENATRFRGPCRSQ